MQSVYIKTSSELIDYKLALSTMEQLVLDISSGEAREMLWLLEHPPLYTAGTSAKEKDLVDAHKFPVYNAGRGGQYTYHGPGQRVAYVMLNLKKRAGAGNVPDIRKYVQTLEKWLINTLAYFGIEGNIRDGRIGVWVDTPSGDCKIAALGVRISKGISYHGISLNIAPNLSHFSGIIPCGIQKYGVTSMEKLGINTTMQEVDEVLVAEFQKLFG